MNNRNPKYKKKILFFFKNDFLKKNKEINTNFFQTQKYNFKLFRRFTSTLQLKKKVGNSLAHQNKFLKKIQIKIKQNNIFFTFFDLKQKKILQIGSSGVYKIKVSKRKLKYFFQDLIIFFFKRLEKWCKNLNHTIFNIIAPITFRKKICVIIKKEIKNFNSNSYKRINKKVNIIINIEAKKCFNGCRERKKIKKKRRLYKIFK